MLLLQNQCNVRLTKYKEKSMNIKFDYWKCIRNFRIYEKDHLISDFKKEVSLAGARTHEIDYFCAAHYLGCYNEPSLM